MVSSLLVLAGGPDRKAWLPVGNSILVRCVAQSLALAFSEVLASFVEPEQLEQPVPYRVAFDRPSSGPAKICGAYRRTALPAISRALEAGHTNTEWVVDQIDVTWLEGQDPDQFRTVTTPDELERLHAALSSQR